MFLHKQVREASSDEVVYTNLTGMLSKHHLWRSQSTILFLPPTTVCNLFSRSKSPLARGETSSKLTLILLTLR